MLRTLKRTVCMANRSLAAMGLVTLTWGNASGIDRESGLMVIKPSGVPYDDLEPQQMAVVDLEGRVVEGNLKPSSDTATHLILYKAFDSIGGIIHTHSKFATMFAQARREIPCLGTTHADHFNGPVPITRPLSKHEVTNGYEQHTGQVIVERFATLDAVAMPAVLVAGHASFAWGANVEKALDNAIALEAVAEMAMGTFTIDAAAQSLEDYVLKKHHARKHGPAAYYGQNES